MASGRRCCHGQGWTTPRVVRESGVAERRGIGARRAKLATQRVQRVHRTAASASAAPSRQPSRPAFLARCSADVRLPDTASTQSCTSLSRAMPSGPHAARRLAARSALSQPLRLIRPPAPAACGPCPLRQPLALRAMSLWAQFPASRGTGSLAERRGPPEAAAPISTASRLPAGSTLPDPQMAQQRGSALRCIEETRQGSGIAYRTCHSCSSTVLRAEAGTGVPDAALLGLSLSARYDSIRYRMSGRISTGAVPAGSRQPFGAPWRDRPALAGHEAGAMRSCDSSM
ncbi:hypothetical protein FA09DRAFT_186839 [Tilletiopsis washingtonensis]|uniref:Uncharacterized protein n=1 Tax=Tilletiopsis washingtonensis TaxID=58919 RepID=A0A316ZG28_9BASI|nr:hypothetical protein FA09DRAFT_186839 [Tilletiopsis washingtonensis]PWO00462.1 hypothetical protein FA09DRAFT_186839 [Tilletiopsis washingtonensis]